MYPSKFSNTNLPHISLYGVMLILYLFSCTKQYKKNKENLTIDHMRQIVIS